MVNRLLMLTAHIVLVQHVLQGMLEIVDVQNLRRLIRGNDTSQYLLVGLEGLIDHKADDEFGGDKQHVMDDGVEKHPQPSAAPLRKFQQHRRSLITNLEAAESAKRSICPRCRGPPKCLNSEQIYLNTSVQV